MIIFCNFLFTFVVMITINSDFTFTKHINICNDYTRKHLNKIFKRENPEGLYVSRGADVKVCSPNEKWEENGKTCICSPDGSIVDCNSVNNQLKSRKKRNVLSNHSKEVGSNCNCHMCHFRNAHFCNCMRNFMYTCMHSFFCNMNYFCNCMHNHFIHNCTVYNQQNRVNCPTHVCCTGSTMYLNKHRHLECNCGCPDKKNDGVRVNNINKNINLNKNVSKLPDLQNPSSSNLEDRRTDDCKTIDIKTLVDFCKMYMTATEGDNKVPRGQIDVNTLSNFCKIQINSMKNDKRQNYEKEYGPNKPKRKDIRSSKESRTLTPVPIFKMKKPKYVDDTFKEKKLRNISRRLVGDYSSDYSLGLNTEDLSSFGLQKDVHKKFKSIKKVRRKNSKKLIDDEYKPMPTIPRIESDSSEKLTYEIGSLGLQFPVSTEEKDSVGSDYNERNTQERKKMKQYKPRQSQLLDSISSSGEDDSATSKKEIVRYKPEKERKHKSKTRKEIKQRQRSNYFNPNNRAFKGEVNQNKLKRAAKKRNQRFNADNSVDDEFVFQQSNDLLNFSI